MHSLSKIFPNLVKSISFTNSKCIASWKCSIYSNYESCRDDYAENDMKKYT